MKRVKKYKIIAISIIIITVSLLGIYIANASNKDENDNVILLEDGVKLIKNPNPVNKFSDAQQVEAEDPKLVSDNNGLRRFEFNDGNTVVLADGFINNKLKASGCI